MSSVRRIAKKRLPDALLPPPPHVENERHVEERRPPKHITGECEISWKKSASIAAALGFEPLMRKVGALDAGKISRLISRAEDRHPPGADKVWAAKLAALEVGKTELVPIEAIRPGQLQISLENVRTKMTGFIERVEARKIDDAHPGGPSLLADTEALTAVVGPGGKYLVLLDGHHHIAALKAVDEMVESIMGDCVLRGGAKQSWKPGRELQRVHDIFHGEESPRVPINIVANMSAMTEKEFWRSMAAGDGPRAYLVDRKGREAKVTPRRFSELEDNPFRLFASQITGKARVIERKLRLSGAEFPVWLKLIDQAPPFIEFALARIIESAFKKARLKYDPTEPPEKEARNLARAALYAAKMDPKHPDHALLAKIPLIVRDVELRRVEKELELDGNAIAASKWLTKPSKRRLARWADHH